MMASRSVRWPMMPVEVTWSLSDGMSVYCLSVDRSQSGISGNWLAVCEFALSVKVRVIGCPTVNCDGSSDQLSLNSTPVAGSQLLPLKPDGMGCTSIVTLSDWTKIFRPPASKGLEKKPDRDAIWAWKTTGSTFMDPLVWG